MNLQIENTKTEIINVINDSGLPIGVIHYLLGDIKNEVTYEYKKALAQEKEELKQRKEQENKGITENEQESEK